MLTVFLGFILLSLVIAGMAIGVIMGRRPITGSCGGIGAALGVKNYNCDICNDDPAKCEEVTTSERQVKTLAYDATKKD